MSRSNEERFVIDGPSGNLELAITEPSGVVKGCAVIAHPHPLYGGTLDNKVVQTLGKAFNVLGLTSVRFNFRGVGKSDGVYDEGVGELEDFKSVQNFAYQKIQPEHTIFAGFSFGTYIVSHAAKLATPDQLVLIAPAVGKFEVNDATDDTLVIHGEEDDVVPLSDVMDWARPQHIPVTVFPGAGHFFHGDLVRLKNVIINHCRNKLPS